MLPLFRMGFFGASHGWGGPKRPPVPKICPSYPTMMNLGTVIPYPKKIQKMYESGDTALAFYRYRLYFDSKFLFILTFLESL